MEAPLEYVPRELQSYLPTGWNLAEETDPGVWDGAKRTWSTQVEDGAEQSWELEVAASEAAEHGRLEALRLAFDRVYRKSLGRASVLG